MHKKFTLIAAILLTISLSATNLMAQQDNSHSGKDVKKKNTPFLITGKIPHLTKILIKQWDNPELALSSDQKAKLLVVRKETISRVQSLAQKISPLEMQVAEEIFEQKTPAELNSLVETIAGLKA